MSTLLSSATKRSSALRKLFQVNAHELPLYLLALPRKICALLDDPFQITGPRPNGAHHRVEGLGHVFELVLLSQLAAHLERALLDLREELLQAVDRSNRSVGQHARRQRAQKDEEERPKDQ